jgi:K+-transporting ATPase KdpF subunit
MKRMKTQTTLLLVALTSVKAQAGDHMPEGHSGYVLGGVIALLIICYLIYTLIRPEKF